jgi:hypothetical protein
MYFHDNDGAMIELCAELAQMPPEGDYLAREWPVDPTRSTSGADRHRRDSSSPASRSCNRTEGP